MKPGWFGPKRIGWGASPRSWQGWVVTLGFIAVLAAAIRWLRPLLQDSTGLPANVILPAIVLGWLALFLAVIWLTYDGEKR
jgi:hypothetical protein